MNMSKLKKPVRLERRVRVTFFLIAETEEERKAVLDLISYLYWQYVHFRSAEKYDLPVTGFTNSAINSSVISHKDIVSDKIFEKGIFWGHWWSEGEDENTGEPLLMPVRERVVFFLIDLPAVAEEWKTDESINLLKEEIFSIYET